MDGNVSVWSDEDYDKDSIKLCVEKIQEAVSYTHLTLPTTPYV